MTDLAKLAQQLYQSPLPKRVADTSMEG